MSTVVEGAKRQPGQPEDVATSKPMADPAQALDFDLPLLHDDKCVTPLGFVVGPLAARPDGNHSTLEPRWKTSGEEGEPVAAQVFVHHSVGGRPPCMASSPFTSRPCLGVGATLLIRSHHHYDGRRAGKSSARSSPLPRRDGPSRRA
jgi:hypothetical protein